MNKRLRILHVIVQPILVWDDGQEFTPFEVVKPIQIPLSELGGMADKLKAEVAQLDRDQEDAR